MTHSYEVRVELIANMAKKILDDYQHGSWDRDQRFVSDMKELKKHVELAIQEAENNYNQGGMR